MRKMYRGEIISVGAEAILIKDIWYNINVLKKIRIKKKYRHSLLDMYLRRKRTIRESKILLRVKRLGIPCPTILDIDLDNNMIVMDYIEGKRVRDIINSYDTNFLKKIFRELGRNIGLLHKNGIIHGDLTTSNMILYEDKIFLIDFGLGIFSNNIEDMGVDVHLFLRSLESFHTEVKDILFKSFIQGYKDIVGEEFVKKIFNQIEEIRSRGRYISKKLRKHY